MLRKLNYAVIGIVLVVLVYEYASPFVATLAYGDKYKNLMYQCDNAMRDHFIAKKVVESKATRKNIINLESSELALMNCHEYDKVRKLMQNIYQKF